MSENLPTKRACAYIRVSTDRQEELSPDAQKRLIADYCKKNGLIIKEEDFFAENGISGKKADKRPLFQHMIAAAKSKEHPFDVILVWKFSRFARNQEESIVYKTMLRRAGVEVVSISEPSVDGPFGSLIERIIEWMDEYYSLRLSDEVMRGMTEKALRGGYQSAMPIGYKMNRETGIPEIYEPEAKTVRLIFDSFLNSGKSFLEIARSMNSLGFSTRRGSPFERRSIMYILQNPFYCGLVRWNRQNRERHALKACSEWITVPGAHAPLISRSDFERAQSLILVRSRPRKSKGTSGIKHWLSGIVKCSSCGRSLVANASWKNRPASFQCGGYNKGLCPHSHFIGTDKLEQAVYEGFKQIIPSEDTIYEAKRSDSRRSDTLSRTDALEALLSQIKAREERARQAYLSGADSLSEYQENKARLAKQRADAEARLDAQNAPSDCASQPKMPDKLRSVYEIITDESLDKLIRSNAVRSVVERFVYDKERDSLEVYFYLDT
ncbi:MAG: recombinase family protein [Butyrivibrio sp.]|nr:recombinase family protein [Butyrivibrio sp.]